MHDAFPRHDVIMCDKIALELMCVAKWHTDGGPFSNMVYHWPQYGWISDYIHYDVCDEMAYPFPNFKIQPFKSENG